MSERVNSTPLPDRFIKHYSGAYPPSIPYKLDPLGTMHLGTSTRDFRESRKDMMTGYMYGRQKHEQMAQGLIAEEMVRLALKPLIKEAGFETSLAPQSLERSEIENGEKMKGVDLIITDLDKLTYLGIDVKLRKAISSRNRDGHGWNSRLKTPFIYLSLGNWDITMRQGESIEVKDWIKEYTLPKLKSTGGIPVFDDFRRYVVGRIERSLNGFREELDGEYKYEYGNLPYDLDEINVLREKVGIMQSLFTDLNQNY